MNREQRMAPVAPWSSVELGQHFEIFGVWRSWLAYLHGVQVVVSSSLTTPTNKKDGLKPSFLFVLGVEDLG
jgi:hypothetical protein